jgi:beta-phosphoglucomutase
VFLKAAEKLAVPPARCIVVEDAAAGVEGARRGGMKSIGVAKNGPLAADIVVISLEDLPPDAFERLLREAAD